MAIARQGDHKLKITTLLSHDALLHVGNPIDSIAANRVMDKDGIRRPTEKDVRTKPTHSDVETMSEKLAYRKFIKDLEFETREVFERENIENIGT